jgi:uncharacterized spore protein YtfJ
MDIRELLSRVSDDLAVKKVFGEPIVSDGVTVIPVARVNGGGGGGGEGDGPGEDGPGGAGEGDGPTGARASGGWGGGFGLRASPVGVYVIAGQEVTWRPAVDVTKIVLGGQAVGVVLLLTLRAVLRRRRRLLR